MPKPDDNYKYIAEKIKSLRTYSFFRDKPDSYIFSALCIKSHFYKNPSFILTQDDIDSMIVDGSYDGDADVLLADPSSEACNIVIGQSKIVFILFTSAPQGKINVERLESKFMEQFSDKSNIEVMILFGSDIVSEIKEAESKRPNIEAGKLIIDRPRNILEYGNDAVIVNVSAMSLKRLYAQYGNNLLARNLRYHIKSGREIDKAISQTINYSPGSFWVRNNGITIICDTFSADGKEIKLTNFSVINGGQTIYILHRSRCVLPEP